MLSGRQHLNYDESQSMDHGIKHIEMHHESYSDEHSGINKSEMVDGPNFTSPDGKAFQVLKEVSEEEIIHPDDVSYMEQKNLEHLYRAYDEL